MRRKRYTVLRSVILLLFIALLLGCDRPSLAHPTAKPGVPLLTFELSGGIAGFQERLVIGYAGEYYLLRKGQTERIGSLSAERRIQLVNWLERFAPFNLRFEDNPGKPDNLIRQLVWAGLGEEIANQVQQNEILNWTNSLLLELAKD